MKDKNEVTIHDSVWKRHGLRPPKRKPTPQRRELTLEQVNERAAQEKRRA